MVLVVTTLYSAAALSAARAERVADDALWSAFFAANVHYAAVGTDYFAEGQATSPLQHFWSLAVEEQFYLVWPGLLAIILLARRPRLRPVLVGVVAVLCMSSFVWSVVLADRSPTAAYFSSPARVWELGIGALLALTADRLRIGQRSAELLAGIGLAAIVVPALVLGRVSTYASWQLVVPVLGHRGAAGRRIRRAAGRGGQGADGAADAVGGRRVVLAVSVALARPRSRRRVRRRVVSPMESGGLVTVAVVLGCAELLRGRSAVPPTTRCVGRAPTWAAAVAGGGRCHVASTIWSGHLAAVAAQEQLQRSQDYYQSDKNQELPEPGTSADPPTLADRIAYSLALADDNAPIPFPLENLEGLGEDLWNKVYDCHADYLDTTVPICPLGDVDADRTVVAIGDSHMAMWLPALEVLGAREGFKVIAFVKYSCAPYDVLTAIEEVGGDYTQCEDFRDWTIQQLERLQPVAILAGARGLAGGLATTSFEERVPEWETGVRSAVTELKTLAPAVKLVADITEQARDPADCLTTRTSTMASCVTKESTRVLLANAMLRRAAEWTHTDYVDVTTLICVGGRCPVVVDRTATYADNDHVSVTWARAVAGELHSLLALPAR